MTVKNLLNSKFHFNIKSNLDNWGETFAKFSPIFGSGAAGPLHRPDVAHSFLLLNTIYITTIFHVTGFSGITN